MHYLSSVIIVFSSVSFFFSFFAAASLFFSLFFFFFVLRSSLIHRFFFFFIVLQFYMAMSHSDAESCDTEDGSPPIHCPYSLLGCCLYGCSVVYEYDQLTSHLEKVALYIGSTSGGGIVVSKLISRANVLENELAYVYKSLPVNYNSSFPCVSLIDDQSVIGVSKNSDESTFTGEIKEGERSGHGVERTIDYVYIGDWVNGQKDGKGFLRHQDGETYEGGWKAGKRHGKGVLKHAGVDRYDGEFENDLKHGFGAYVTLDGSNISYDGIWENGQLLSSKKRRLIQDEKKSDF